MNVRHLFSRVSTKLRADFEITKEALHRGGKGTNREALVRELLRELLPRRYSLAKGEAVSSENKHSDECDVVIYDGERCPKLLVEPSHGLFPIECIFGVVQVKTTLNNEELESAYKNIASVKGLVQQGTFELSPSPMMRVGMSVPLPVGVVVGFAGGRSLEVIAKQARTLDASLLDKKLRPDLLVVLDEGIVGPRAQLRDRFNRVTLPEADDLVDIRRTKRHTLLGLYLRLLEELDAVTLPPLALSAYLDMPEVIGGRRVRGHNRLNRFVPSKGPEPEVRRLSASAIEKIVSESKPTTYENRLKMAISADLSQVVSQLKDPKEEVLVYNPQNLPPLDPATIKFDERGTPSTTEKCFSPVELEIDGRHYAADISGFGETDFEVRDDLDADELFAE